MSFSKPDIPPPKPPPAKQPERAEVLTSEDVQLGVPEEEGSDKRGKRSLARPAPAGVGITV